MRGTAQTTDERGLDGSEEPHGTKVVSNDALRGFYEHVSGPDGISARDPGTMLATQRHAREREGIACKA